MLNIVIVYYSGYGYMQKLVEVVYVGVQDVGVVVCFFVVGEFDDVGWVVFDVVDVIVFGVLIYMGGLFVQFK